MVVHEHYAHCEEVKLSDFTDDQYVIDDAELGLRFVTNQRDVHKKDGEILNEFSEDVTHVFKIPTEELVDNDILEAALEQDDYLITTDFKHLVDLDLLQEFVRDMLIEIGHTNHLFLHNSVERLQKDLSVQIYNLLRTDGATATNNNILVGLKVVNMHCYANIVEYHTSTLMSSMEIVFHNDQHVNQLNEHEDELLQFVQSASMEMEQPGEPIGASSASIDALERIKHKPEDCKEVTCCSVCFEEFMTEEEIRKMPCSSAHIFHIDCIEKWLKINHICPVCRYQMPTE